MFPGGVLLNWLNNAALFCACEATDERRTRPVEDGGRTLLLFVEELFVNMPGREEVLVVLLILLTEAFPGICGVVRLLREARPLGLGLVVEDGGSAGSFSEDLFPPFLDIVNQFFSELYNVSKVREVM